MRGATRLPVLASAASKIFLLPPLREGRLCRPERDLPECEDFYSRPYARGDKRAVHQRDLGRPISTHAPTRGATCLVSSLFLASRISTHAPTRGATFTAEFRRLTMCRFLLTPLREGRLLQLCGIYGIIQIISTHAPTRGATHEKRATKTSSTISTHAPTRGATGFVLFFAKDQKIISTHAPTRGATCALANLIVWFLVFLLTPLREGRRARTICTNQSPEHFYSRPYARGDSNFSQNHKLIYMINC